MYSPAGPQPERWYCLWRSVRAQPPRPPAPRRGYSPSVHTSEAGATVRLGTSMKSPLASTASGSLPLADSETLTSGPKSLSASGTVGARPGDCHYHARRRAAASASGPRPGRAAPASESLHNSGLPQWPVAVTVTVAATASARGSLSQAAC
jgi:hypothetical protein